jgi:glycosyltransferase involved in cell wall biosynthesis
MKCFVFPPLVFIKNDNEYLSKLFQCIADIGFVVNDKNYHNGIWSLFNSLFKNYDLIYLNWYGLSGYSGLKGIIVEVFHFLVFIVYLLKGGKIVFVIHNFNPHKGRLYFRFFHDFYYKNSNLLICHSTIVYNFIGSVNFNKTAVIPHPTKPELLDLIKKGDDDFSYDFLVWGSMIEYKGIKEIVMTFKNYYSNYKLAIVGKCSDVQLAIWLKKMTSGTNIHIDLQNIDDDSIIEYHQRSQYILFNYLPDSAIISGSVMFSLSLGSRICVRRGTQYSCLSDLGCIFLFDSIDTLVNGYRNYCWQEENQINYVLSNDWSSFRLNLERLLK